MAVAATARKQNTAGGGQALAGKLPLSLSAKATLTTAASGVSLNFTGTNGAAPPSPLALVTATSGSTATIQSNQLRFHLAALGGYGDLLVYGFTPSSQDFTISCDLELNATSGEQFTRILFRADASGNDDFVDYAIDTAGNAFIDCGYRTAYSETSLGGVGGLSITGATVMHVKIDRRGTGFKVKYWMDAAAEPGTWNLADTTSGVHTTGQICLMAQGGGIGAAHDHDFDNLVVVY